MLCYPPMVRGPTGTATMGDPTDGEAEPAMTSQPMAASDSNVAAQLVDKSPNVAAAQGHEQLGSAYARPGRQLISGCAARPPARALGKSHLANRTRSCRSLGEHVVCAHYRSRGLDGQPFWRRGPYRRRPPLVVRTMARAEASAPEHAFIQRRDARRSIDLEQGIRWELLTPNPEPGAEFLEVTYPVGGSSSPTKRCHPPQRS